VCCLEEIGWYLSFIFLWAFSSHGSFTITVTISNVNIHILANFL
jgi:hypothetical protein